MLNYVKIIFLDFLMKYIWPYIEKVVSLKYQNKKIQF